MGRRSMVIKCRFESFAVAFALALVLDTNDNERLIHRSYGVMIRFISGLK